MKKFILIALVVAALAMPAAAQGRLDIGFFAPKGFGVSGGGDINSALAKWPMIPIPDLGLYYQGDLGLIKLGIGARAFSAIVETFAWPNAYAELDIDFLAIQAQFGGGVFAMFGVAPSQIATGKVFIPDLSAWVKLGKKGVIRLGIGAMGLYIPEVLGDTVPFLLYLGGKAAIGI
jgi:hypothetical protein